MINPVAGAVATGPFTVRIEAADRGSRSGSLTVTYRIDATGLQQITNYNPFTRAYEDTLDPIGLSSGSHSITARATDGSGNTGISPTVTFSVDNSDAPLARITSPASGSLVSETVTISAAITDDRSVSRVEFLLDGVGIGTDPSSSGGWNITWDTTTAARGRHALSVRTTDSAGVVETSETVVVTVDQKPTTDIILPRSLALVRERLTIAVSADDDSAIEQIAFFVDGRLISTDISPAGGWRASWNSRNVGNGRRTLRVIATDDAGQTAVDSIVVTVDNDLTPTMTITGPRDGTTIYAVGVVAISAEAADDDEIDQVEFFVDGTSIAVDTNGLNGWTATWNPSRASIGEHSIRAVATDTVGQTAADENRVTVQAFTTATTTPTIPSAPSEPVELDTPAQGLLARAFSVSPSTVSSGGEVALSITMGAETPGWADVQFLLNGEPLGDPATVNALYTLEDIDTAEVFTRTMPTGMQTGLHRIDVVTTAQPPTVLASRTIGVVAGAAGAAGQPLSASIPPTANAGLLTAMMVGSIAALTAASFGMAGRYRRRIIMRRLATRSW